MKKPDANCRWTGKAGRKTFHSQQQAAPDESLWEEKSFCLARKPSLIPAWRRVGETGAKWKCKHTHTVAEIFRDFTQSLYVCWSRRERGARTWMGSQRNSTEKMFISLALRRPEKNEIKTKRMPLVWRALHSCRLLSTRVGSVFAFRDEAIHSNYHGKISRKAPQLRWKFIFI